MWVRYAGLYNNPTTEWFFLLPRAKYVRFELVYGHGRSSIRQRYTHPVHTHTHAPSHFIHSIIIIIITISLVREGIHIDIYDSAHHWMLIAFMRNIINISSFRSPFYMNIEYEYVKAQCAMLFGCRSVWYSSTFIAFVDIAFQAFGINSFVWLMLITRWIRNGKQFQSMLIHILFFRSTSLSPFTISSVWLCVCVCVIMVASWSWPSKMSI